MIYNITPSHELVPYSVLRKAWIMSGIGLGPVVYSLVCDSAEMQTVGVQSAYSLSVVACLWLLVAAASCYVLPSDLASLLKAKEDEEAAAENGNPQEAEQNIAKEHDVGNLIETLTSEVRKNLWFSSLTFCAERALIVSMLEAVSAFILEKEFGFDLNSVGFLVGITFFLGLPLTLSAKYVAKLLNLSDVALMSISVFIATCGTILLCPFNEGHGFGFIIIADTLVFSFAWLADGIMTGIASHAAMSDNICNLENMFLWDALVRDSFSRSLGPPMGRWILDNYGRLGYFACQLSLNICGCLCCWSVSWHLTRTAGTLVSNNKEQ
eukprot:gnl/MRDRNA2_/MRDRNA2_66785_c0_seq1.p1 gnl/MRDRNA2_/MRDRNA2_66785_c0~~gnl/MRDRNA2_/MRDRNA2_66785_c0_seq1.p1  ORF type:complete len:344 (-),score=28.42 gnl/MRDRNA2_/MRDRNA2_66785_c0_seq1:93-1064(-)